MKKSIFTLADVLNVLTALTFGFICFLGKNFSTLGNTYESITWGIIIAVSLAGTAFIAKLLKRTSRNFKTNFILEIVVLLMFTGLTVYFAYSPFPHYFNVSANKTEIQNKLQTSITQAENMFAYYEDYAGKRERTYKSDLDAAVSLENPGELKKFHFKDKGEMTYEKQSEHKISKLKTDLLPDHYSDTVNDNGIKEVATAWLKSAKGTVNSWKPIGIVNVVNDVENNSIDWLNQLYGFAKKLGDGQNEADDLEYSLEDFKDVKTHFTTPGKPTPLSIGLAAGAYLLMLLSWFVTKRDTRKGFKTAAYEVIL